MPTLSLVLHLHRDCVFCFGKQSLIVQRAHKTSELQRASIPHYVPLGHLSFSPSFHAMLGTASPLPARQALFLSSTPISESCRLSLTAGGASTSYTHWSAEMRLLEAGIPCGKSITPTTKEGEQLTVRQKVATWRVSLGGIGLGSAAAFKAAFQGLTWLV